MNTTINLLLRTDEESLKRKKKIKIFNLAAAASLIGIGLISIIIFVLLQVISPKSIKKEQEDVIEKMSRFQSRQVKLFIFNNRVENIDKILKIRKDLSKTTSSLLAKIPSGLSIDNLEVDDKSIIISGQSKSLLTISEFIDNLTDMVHKKEIIKSLTLISLLLDENRSTYQVSIKSEL